MAGLQRQKIIQGLSGYAISYGNIFPYSSRTLLLGVLAGVPDIQNNGEGIKLPKDAQRDRRTLQTSTSQGK